MSSEPTRIAIGIIWSGNRIVVGRRSEDAVLGGHDELPGGKCLPEESFSAAVVRECREETGQEVQVLTERLRLEHEYPHGTLELVFFDCLAGNGGGATELHSPFRWVEINELDRLNFPPANAKVLRSLQERPRPLREKSGD